MKWLKIVAIVVGVYLVIGLAFEAAIGHFQPEGARTAALRTFDPDGQWHDRVLLLHEEDGRYWVESGHWFRAWYNRLLENPDVELIHPDGATGAYTAVPVQTREAVDMLTRKMGKGQHFAYWIARTLSMYAPIKPVRLDPREGVAALDSPEDEAAPGSPSEKAAPDSPEDDAAPGTPSEETAPGSPEDEAAPGSPEDEAVPNGAENASAGSGGSSEAS